MLTDTDDAVHGLGDMQLSGEFVAYAIGHLAAKSSTGMIDVVAYSQGGTNVSLVFFRIYMPSRTVGLVSETDTVFLYRLNGL